MANSPTYLLDTAVLLHWVRASKVAQIIDGQFQFQSANFRPSICEVSLGEIAAFSRAQNWGQPRKERLSQIKKQLVVVDISDAQVVDACADFSTLAKNNGWAIFHGKNDLWIAAAAKAAGATLLTVDKDFTPLGDGQHLDVILLDAMSGWKIS